MLLLDLMDEIKRSEEFQTRNAEDLKRVAERMASLEEVRHVNLELVAKDNRNAEAHKRVDESDHEIATLKRKKSALQRRIRTGVRSRRKRILETRERVLSDLDARLKAKQDQQTELRGQSIPEAERTLQALREQLEQCEEGSRRIQNEIREVNALEVDSFLPR